LLQRNKLLSKNKMNLSSQITGINGPTQSSVVCVSSFMVKSCRQTATSYREKIMIKAVQ